MVKIGTTLSPLGKKAVLCRSANWARRSPSSCSGTAPRRSRRAGPLRERSRHAGSSSLLRAFDARRGASCAPSSRRKSPTTSFPRSRRSPGGYVLLELEKEGYNVIPTARATRLTMNREGIRRLAAEELGIPTSPYRFASDYEEFVEAVGQIGTPCVVKPVMSSSGHGRSVVRSSRRDRRGLPENSQKGGRAGAGRVIVEGFVDFDYEITLLTVRHCGGTSFLEPIGHYQQDGRLPRVVAAAADESGRSCAGRGDGPPDYRGARWLGTVRRGAVRPGRSGYFQRGLSASARHGHGDDDLAGFVGVRASRTRRAGTADSQHRLSRPFSVAGRRGRGRHEPGWSSPTSRTCFRNPIRRFGFSVSPGDLEGHRRVAVLLARAESVEQAREKTARAYAKLQVNVFDRETQPE